MFRLTSSQRVVRPLSRLTSSRQGRLRATTTVIHRHLRHFQTGAMPQGSAERVVTHPDHHQNDVWGTKQNNTLLLLGMLAMAYFIYDMVKNNTQIDVVDKSVLKNDEYANSDLLMYWSHTLKVECHEPTSGRSGGYKVIHQGEDEVHRHYYFKKPFDREELLKELVVGALGHLLLPAFPRVCAVETPVNDIEDHSRYDFISESLGEPDGNMNLEAWSIQYAGQAHEVIPLKNLGVALAFDKLFGKSDSKLANLVAEKKDGFVYPIDNESAFHESAGFIVSPEQALDNLGEFRGKTMAEHAIEVASTDHLVDTQQDNRFQPLKGNKQVKSAISPVLLASINEDIQNRQIIQLYEKFAALTVADFNGVFNQFGGLIHEDERKKILSELQTRQAQTRQYLADHQKESVPAKSIALRP